ncbi:hypothetical protein DPEC_G00362680 [Dallia pectoralis]|nr:hypothetical protein DPEC_G00362680 [Dallia pectoralis]
MSSTTPGPLALDFDVALCSTAGTRTPDRATSVPARKAAAEAAFNTCPGEYTQPGSPGPKRVRLVERYEDFATAEMAERVLEHRPGRVHAKELLTELQLAFFHMAMVKFQIKDTVDLENKAWAIIRYGQRSGVWPDDPWVPNRCRTPFVAYVMEKIKTNLRRRAKTALLEESRRSL